MDGVSGAAVSNVILDQPEIDIRSGSRLAAHL
jgi:hypothetical protein